MQTNEESTMKQRPKRLKAHTDWTPHEAKEIRANLRVLKVNRTKIEAHYRAAEEKKKHSENRMADLIKKRTEHDIRILAMESKLTKGRWFS